MPSRIGYFAGRLARECSGFASEILGQVRSIFPELASELAYVGSISRFRYSLGQVRSIHGELASELAHGGSLDEARGQNCTQFA